MLSLLVGDPILYWWRCSSYVARGVLHMRRETGFSWHRFFHWWRTHVLVVVFIQPAVVVCGPFVFMCSAILLTISPVTQDQSALPTY